MRPLWEYALYMIGTLGGLGAVLLVLVIIADRFLNR